MSTNLEEKAKILMEVLKALHKGESIESLKNRFGSFLAQVSPFEIPLVEQQLVREGVPISEILRLCDLHVELFKEHLRSRALEGVPRGHPLELLMRENDWILKQAEILGVYSSTVLKAEGELDTRSFLELKNTLSELRRITLHYRKIQMLIFPYFERRGIIAVPRVMWGREDEVKVKLRDLLGLMGKVEHDFKGPLVNDVAKRALEIAREVSEIVFRENKILFPAAWALLSEGEWAAIAEIAEDLGYIVDVGEEKWKSRLKPILPYELKAEVSMEQVEKLPPEFRSMTISQGLQSDDYEVKGREDLDLETGFLSPGEVKALFRALPLELTYADRNDRVKFFTQGVFRQGFLRTKTILGRRFEFCHPPRLENLVRKIADELKAGEADYREFWTKIGDRTVRVLIVPVRNGNRDHMGVVEIVEDLTEVVENPEEVKKKIMVL